MRSRALAACVLPIIAVLAGCGSNVPDTVTREAITYEQFQKLAVGQTMAQVTGIVGHAPTSYKTQAVGDGAVEVDEWVNADGSGAAVVQSKGSVVALKSYRLDTPKSPAYVEAKKRVDALDQHS